MATRDQIYLDVIADTKKSIGNIAKLAVGIGAAIAVAKKAYDAMKQMIDAASAAEEIFSKFSVVFGDVSITAESAAQRIASSYGLAVSSTKELLSSTGDLLTGLGFTDSAALGLSEQVAELAVDLASFSNYSGGAEGAAEALTKALLGEREMIKTLGISILETDLQQRLMEKGMGDLTGMALKQARAETTLEMAIEQSQNAMGDYHRTSESYANVSRRLTERSKELKEELGKSLLPVMGKLKQGMIDIVEKATAWIEKSNELREATQKLREGAALNVKDEIALQREVIKNIEKEIATKKNMMGMNDDVLKGDYERLAMANRELALLNLTEQSRIQLEKRREEEAEAAKKAAEEAALANEKIIITITEADKAYVDLVKSGGLRDFQGALEEINQVIEDGQKAWNDSWMSGHAQELGGDGNNTYIKTMNEDLVDFMDNLENLATNAGLDAMYDLGEALASGDDAMQSITDSLIDFVSEITKSVSELLILAGTQIIAANPVAGLALIAAGLGLSLGAGALSGVDTSSVSENTASETNITVQGSVVTTEQLTSIVDGGIRSESRGW